jgi:hypothetical protein
MPARQRAGKRRELYPSQERLRLKRFAQFCLLHFKLTSDGELLDDELAFYLMLFTMFPDDADLNRIAKAREFCTNKGVRRGDNIYGKTARQLSDPQFDFLERIWEVVISWLTALSSGRLDRRARRGDLFQ